MENFDPELKSREHWPKRAESTPSSFPSSSSSLTPPSCPVEQGLRDHTGRCSPPCLAPPESQPALGPAVVDQPVQSIQQDAGKDGHLKSTASAKGGELRS